MPSPRSALVSVLLVFLAGGCASREEASATPSSERPLGRAAAAAVGPEAPEEVGAQAAPEPEAYEAAAEPRGEPSPALPRARESEDDRLERAARRALAEAARVPAGQNDCETAYARLSALVASMAREDPTSVRELPAQDRFLATCARLPAEMQRCLVVEHAIDHEAECAREHQALEPELRASLDALMNGGG